jgi:hypothetical protein
MGGYDGPCDKVTCSRDPEGGRENPSDGGARASGQRNSKCKNLDSCTFGQHEDVARTERRGPEGLGCHSDHDGTSPVLPHSVLVEARQNLRMSY